MLNQIKSKTIQENTRTMNKRPTVTKIDDIQDDTFYRVADLQAVLKHQGLNYSIFSIRDAETWKCSNYGCGKRYSNEVTSCPKCGAAIFSPYIDSPRTVGGGKGFGHRRYSGADIKKIVSIFRSRIQ